MNKIDNLANEILREMYFHFSMFPRSDKRDEKMKRWIALQIKEIQHECCTSDEEVSRSFK